MDRPRSADLQAPPLLEALLGVHAASSIGWLADAAATAAERGLGALYGVLYVLDGSGQLAGERPASTERRLAKLQQLLQADVTSLRFMPETFPELARVLQQGTAAVAHDLGRVLPIPMDEARLKDVQGRLGIAKIWLAPLHLSGESTGLLVLLMPSATPAPLAQAEVLGRHVAVALNNLRERDAGRKLGEIDAVCWVYDERRFSEQLVLECKRAQRHGHPVSVLLLRVQNKDELLKRYGRFLLERILRHVAGRIVETVRDTDFIGAVGDDGLAAILVEADRDGAMRAEQRLLAALDATTLSNADLPGLNVEFACATATMPDDGSSAAELAEAALARLWSSSSLARGEAAA